MSRQMENKERNWSDQLNCNTTRPAYGSLATQRGTMYYSVAFSVAIMRRVGNIKQILA